MAEAYYGKIGKRHNETCISSCNHHQATVSGGIAIKTVTFKIFRYDPSQDHHPRYKTYQLSLEENMTLLMALRYIYEKIDNTLAFRNYCCGVGPLCGSCLLAVNSKQIYACSMPLKGDENLIIEPVPGFPIIKDLVVDWGIKIAGSSDYSWEIRKGALVTHRNLTQLGSSNHKFSRKSQ